MVISNLDTIKSEDLDIRLKIRLRQPLPGIKAQLRMAPLQRQMTPLSSDTPRHAAVMIPLYHTESGIGVLFTVRAATLSQHSGEISFPGGRVEPQDSSAMAAAMREAYEEIHLPPQSVQWLGQLTPLYIPPSQNWVIPCVGWIAHLPDLAPDPREVSRILTVPLTTLCDPHTVSHYPWMYEGQFYHAPSYCVNGWHIWGATAMILSELLEVIGAVSDSEQML